MPPCAASGSGGAGSWAARLCRWLWSLAIQYFPFQRLTPDQARLAVQCAISIAAGCLFCVIDPLWEDLLRTGVWVIVTVLVVLEPNVGSSLRKSWLRIVGTVVGCAVALAVLEIAYAVGGGQDWAEHAVPMAVVVTVLQSLLGALMLIWKVQHPARSYGYLVAAFTLPIVWVPGLRASPSQEVLDAIRRTLSILIGIAIPGLVQVTVFPVFACRQLTERLAAALEEAVEALAAAAKSAMQAPAGGDGSGLPGSRTALLQRAQRKKASGLDKLLEPTKTELRFLRGPLTVDAFSALIEAVAVVGSTTVGLSAALEAGRLDDTAAALASAFAALAARIRGTLHSCCLQRHACEERLFCCRPPRPPLAASKLGLGEALDAAAASFRQLEAAHEAARGQLSPNEADLAVLALCACMVLLQQARAAAAVLDAATPVAAPPEQCEEVQRGLEETAGGAGELQDKV